MKKKLILMLGAASAVVAPIATVISCNENNDGDKNKESDKTTKTPKPTSKLNAIIVNDFDWSYKNINFPDLPHDNGRATVMKAKLDTAKGKVMKDEMKKSTFMDDVIEVYRIVYGQAQEFYIVIGTKAGAQVIFTEGYGVYGDGGVGSDFKRFINNRELKKYEDGDTKTPTNDWKQTEIIISALMANKEFFSMG